MSVKLAYSRLWFLLLVGFAFFTRLYGLGDSAFRADTILFFNECRGALSGWEIFSQWMSRPATNALAQFPFPLAFSKGFLGVLGLEATDFNIRLPSALWGVLTVVVAYCAGREFAGKRFGLFFMTMVALSSYHLQLTREAYFYPPLVAGSMILVWVVLRACRSQSPGARLPWTFFVGLVVGNFLVTFSHFTGWVLAAVVDLYILAVLVMRVGRLKRSENGEAWEKSRPMKELLGVVLGTLAVAIPLLDLDWAVPYLMNNVFNEERIKASIATMRANTLSVPEMVSLYLSRMFLGSTLLRTVLTVAVMLSVIGLCFRTRRGALRNRHLVITVLMVLGVVVYMPIMSTQGIYFAVRHVAFTFPFFLLMVASGVWRMFRIPVLRRRLSAKSRLLIRAGFVVVVLGLMIRPAWASIKLEGKPIPYKKLVDWADSTFPAGTPLVVDRWFEPWNELQVYPASNVVFTFTVPDEPYENFQRMQWRNSVMQFMQQYPDGAYVELVKNHWERPDVGPWAWPRQYFMQHTQIVNTAGLYLRETGLGYREDYYGTYTNRVVLDVFYNLPSDLPEVAHRSGRRLALILNEGWGFQKPWRQSRSYQPWRSIDGHAAFTLHNISAAPLYVDFSIPGFPTGAGVKRLTSSTGGTFDYQPNSLSTWNFTQMKLPPGPTRIELKDPTFSFAPNRLFVTGIQITSVSVEPRVAAPAQAPASPPAAAPPARPVVNP